MSIAHKGFKVKQHKPWKMWISIIVVLLLFWAFFVLGQAYQSYQLMQLDLERATLLSKIDELESRNHTLVKNQFFFLREYFSLELHQCPAGPLVSIIFDLAGTFELGIDFYQRMVT